MHKDNKAKLKTNGDCYRIAYNKIMNENYEYLVHGIVTGQGVATGYIFGHAWLEQNGYAFDYSIKNKPLIAPIELYYAKGKIDPNKVVKYSKTQAMEMGNKKKNYGPWNEDGLGNLGYKKINNLEQK